MDSRLRVSDLELWGKRFRVVGCEVKGLRGLRMLRG